MRLDKAVADSASLLEAAGVKDPQREARLLLGYILNKQLSFIFAFPETELTAEEITEFDRVVKRRAAREPFQYIVGKRELYGLDFIVTPDVLIPRPETEFLVEAAIEHLSCITEPHFLDIGTGSGCIPISILKNLTDAKAVAVDISPEALNVAEQNAKFHNVSDRLDLKLSNLYTDLEQVKFDLIASNPPYISTDEMTAIQPEVIDHEPHLALTDGADGLSIIKDIISRAPHYLKSGGIILIEIGSTQSHKVSEMFLPDIWTDVTFIPDLQQIPRIASARLK